MFLFIDTALNGCHVAVADDTTIRAIYADQVTRGHAETLMPIVQDTLKRAEVTLDRIDKIIVTIGPGSFTGLRVGLTAARFLGMGLDIPVYGIDCFSAFSVGVHSHEERLILIETRRSDFYVQAMNAQHQPLDEMYSVEADQIDRKHYVLTGDAVVRFVEITGATNKTQVQNQIDLNAVIKALQNNVLSLHAPDPLYIRDADVSKPKDPIHKTS